MQHLRYFLSVGYQHNFNGRDFGINFAGGKGANHGSGNVFAGVGIHFQSVRLFRGSISVTRRDRDAGQRFHSCSLPTIRNQIQGRKLCTVIFSLLLAIARRCGRE